MNLVTEHVTDIPYHETNRKTIRPFCHMTYDGGKKKGTAVEQDRQRMYNVTLRRVRATTVAVKKAKSIRPTYCERVIATLGIQHTMRMRHIAIYALP